MKEFKSKGISLENMVGADPMKEKKTAGTPGKAYNQTIVLTEDLVWELRTFAADHRYRGVKTVIEAMIGCAALVLVLQALLRGFLPLSIFLDDPLRPEG